MRKSCPCVGAVPLTRPESVALRNAAAIAGVPVAAVLRQALINAGLHDPARIGRLAKRLNTSSRLCWTREVLRIVETGPRTIKQIHAECQLHSDHRTKQINRAIRNLIESRRLIRRIRGGVERLEVRG